MQLILWLRHRYVGAPTAPDFCIGKSQQNLPSRCEFIIPDKSPQLDILSRVTLLWEQLRPSAELRCSTSCLEKKLWVYSSPRRSLTGGYFPFDSHRRVTLVFEIKGYGYPESRVEPWMARFCVSHKPVALRINANRGAPSGLLGGLGEQSP